MVYQGVLKKMMTENAEEIQYYLDMKSDFLNMNQLINKEVKLSFVTYECLNCHLEKKIYRQGFCQSCFFDIPQAADWIMRPELSKAHLDEEDRDLAYEKKVQLQPHIVYLANSSNVKVGVTRKQQVPTRWIDQGAHEAIEILEVPNRYLAGIAEVKLKNKFSDKTNWRKMLTSKIDEADIKNEKKIALDSLGFEFEKYFKLDSEVMKFNYQIDKLIDTVKSNSLKKSDNIEGKLIGIKGQYLIFDDSSVFNVRSNEGYVVDITISD